MKLSEAYEVLGLNSGATPEEAKKKYRELSKKMHPDINKEPGAEDKFKKINEAYKCIQEGKGNEREPVDFGGFNPFQDFSRSRPLAENINLYTTISFKDSVLGIKKELKFNRNGKCDSCEGQGEIKINNGCANCGGKGQVVGRQGNMVFIRTCEKCRGKSSTESCKSCNSEGSIKTDVSITVTIPGGVVSGNVLRLGGMGNYAGHFMGMEQFTDAFLHINVLPEEGLTLVGKDVISKTEISLLEALQGCSKTIKTVLGDKIIDIKPLSRNGEEVIIPKFGVGETGNHRVVLDVIYPQNTELLINKLKEI